MKRREPSFALLSLTVILPLLMLAVLAWLGTRSQMRAAIADANTEARLMAESAAANLQSQLTSRMRAVPVFDDPPQPISTKETSIPSEEDALEDLRQALLQQEESFLPSGLPKRAVAAMRIVEMTGNDSDADNAIRMVTEDSPSVLTSVILERINERFPGKADKALEQWKSSLRARDLLTQVDSLDANGEWIEDIWFRHQPDGIRYLSREDFEEGVSEVPPAYQRWAALVVTLVDKTIRDDRPPSDPQHPHDSPEQVNILQQMIASQPVPFDEVNLRVSIVPKRLTTYLSLVKLQTRWTAALLAISIIGAVAGLWVIRRVYERERKLNTLKSDFVASVSHELRAPIASIRLMADALEDGKIQPGTAGEFHRLISREGARLSTLIENVLDFASIEQGRKEWHREESDLRKLILDTVSLMEPLASEKGIRLQTDLPEEASALIDPDAIRQALVNLIDNAVKFSPKDSSVKISLSGNEIRITDQGPGIPKAEHDRIFEKFHRLGGELRRETQGTGIGLSLVKAIAEAHGGSVAVESEPDQGSTFILTLPNA